LVRCRLLFRNTSSVAYPATTATILGPELAVARVSKMAQRPLGFKAALEALSRAPFEHPTHELLLRLIANDVAWESVWLGWESLEKHRATWRTLLSDMETSGKDVLCSRLNTEYGLTVGEAGAVAKLLLVSQRPSTRISGIICHSWGVVSKIAVLESCKPEM
jgi:hypothetical protein